VSDRPPSGDLRVDAKALEAYGYKLKLFAEDGFDDVQIYGYPMPTGYSRSESDLLLRVPPSYRAGRPDMFWTAVDLVLANGQVPAQAEVIETIEGTQWRRFSWHPAKWNPATDNLFTFLGFVDTRLAKRR
jgi:hypothetical protein